MPNGFNINRDVGSTAPAALAAKVREMRADIGIALDGDADRVVDHRREGPPRRRRPADGGDRAVPGPRKAASRSPASSSPSCPISASSATSTGLGLAVVRTPVGDRYVAEAMREHGYNLGGEQSGHIIMSDYTTTGDGLVAALAAPRRGEEALAGR